MKKIIVIGCPGSGKSTLSRALSEKTGIPLSHLDMLYWNADKSTVEKSVFLKRLYAVLEKDAWIIDGNYASTMEERMAASDTVIFLDFPVALCLKGVAERRGKKRSDMPWIETEDDEEFLAFIQAFNQEQRPRILALLEAYKEGREIFVLHNREEATVFLSCLNA